MKKIRVYALYHGDKWLTDGTKKELADYLNVCISTITFYMSKTYAKRNKEGYRVIFICEEYENKI